MNRLQERRMGLGLSQLQVSAKLKETEPRADVGMVSRYEKGVCLPTVSQLKALEEILGATRAELYDPEDLDLLGILPSGEAHSETDQTGVPGGNQRSVSAGERTSSKASETWAKDQGEGCGACEDEIAPPPSHAGRFRKCYRISREFAESLPDDLLQVCGYSSWQSWHDAALKRLLGEYAARCRGIKKKEDNTNE